MSHSNPPPQASDEDVPITIPVGHHTTTGSLFALEQIRSLIGDYPLDFFFQLESSRTATPQIHPPQDLALVLATLDLNRDVTDILISSFFTSVQPHFPILDQDSFTSFFENTLRGNGYDDAYTALCLVVLALGKLATTGLYDGGDLQGSENVAELEYFSPAYHILVTQWVTSFGSGVSLPTGLVLAAIYLCYLARPLPAWKLVYMASSKLQLLVSQSEHNPETSRHSDIIGRLCWTCFLLECDSLAEFDLPRSGIEVAIDRMQFPQFNNRNDRDGLLFLALCSVRRLLNRIHNAVYASGTKEAASNKASSGPSIFAASEPDPVSPASSTVSSLESVLAELTRQLDVWYYSLPDIIKPDFSHNTPSDSHDAWLRLRYWSAKHIISRPCLIYAASLTDCEEMPPYVSEYSEMCVESCRNYIETAVHILGKRTQYTWMTIQGSVFSIPTFYNRLFVSLYPLLIPYYLSLSLCRSLATVFVLVITSRSVLLQHLVLDFDVLLNKFMASTELWASLGFSMESISLMLKTVQQKQKLFRAAKYR